MEMTVIGTEANVDTTWHEPTVIAVARGDGIGPEIMDAVLRIMDTAGAVLQYHFIDLGLSEYERGHSAGISPFSWSVIRRSAALLKAPVTTPLGSGFKSPNVTIRKALNLFANVRPSKSYTPFVASAHPGMNLVIIRENEEDLYAGIEHQQTREVTQVLKLITRPGTERIIRYAFEYARTYGRRKVTCMTKDNIMKLTDGLFHKVFDEVSREYPDLVAEHMIIDIGTAKLATQPEQFDVIVTLNLYGDILSDVAAQIAGSVGLAGSANIGPHLSMFEAVHGSAPDIAGKNIANPSGLLVAATQLLVHIGQTAVAETVKNAWLTTLEDGIHTADIYQPNLSQKRVGTDAFTQAIVDRLGEQPKQLQPVKYFGKGIHVEPSLPSPQTKELVGVDVFLDWNEAGRNPAQLAAGLEAAAPAFWQLKMITNRGVKVYPDGLPETYCTDHWRCRFLPGLGNRVEFAQVLELLQALDDTDHAVIKLENLYTFDGIKGYSLGQGE